MKTIWLNSSSPVSLRRLAFFTSNRFRVWEFNRISFELNLWLITIILKHYLFRKTNERFRRIIQAISQQWCRLNQGPQIPAPRLEAID